MSSSSHSPLSPQQSNLNSPSVTIILTIILLVFFFVGFFSIYFCRCFMDSMLNSWHLRRTPSGNIINGGAPANEGLDPSLILLFPSFIYSSVKDFRWEKNIGLECAICIAEFEDDDSLRLLTVCSHVFHQECIDLWLKSHKTCPVCRSDLNLPRETLEKAQILDHYNVNDLENTHLDLINNDTNRKIEPVFEHTICIDVKDDDDDEKCQRENGEGKTTRDHDRDRDHDHTKVGNKNLERIERFSRSHSTGHSIAMTREDEDRYTSRLLEHVKFKIKNAHNTTESCITFGEFSSGDLNCV